MSTAIGCCLQRQLCDHLVSGNIRFMQIFCRVPWRGGVKQQCVLQFCYLHKALALISAMCVKGLPV